MAFVKSLITGSSAPAPVAAPTTSPFQTNQGNLAYYQNQNAQDQQYRLMQALAAQGGIQNQSSVFNQQQNLANQLQGVANGTGPNPVLDQFNQSTGQNIASQAALQAGQRGSSANVGLLARQIGQQGAATQQQAAGQSATLQAQQQMAGLSALQGQQQLLGNTSGQQVNQQAQATGAINQDTLNNFSNVANAVNGNNNVAATMQGNINNANAQIAGSQNQLGGQILGGAASGISAGLTAGALAAYKGGMIPGYDCGGTVMKSGGTVPGTAPLPGNKPQNDTVPAMLSPKEIVLPRSITMGKNPGDKAKSFVEALMAKKKSKENDGLKKLSSDAQTTVLIHPKTGHKIVVAHNALSPEMKNKLSAIPQHFDEGGDVESEDDAPQDDSGHDALAQQVLSQNQSVDQPQDATPLINPQLADTPGPSFQPLAASPALSTPIPGAPTNGYDAILKGIGEQKAGAYGVAAAEGALGKQQAQILGQQVAQNELLNQNFQDNNKQYGQAISDFIDANQNQKIDPNRVFANQSTGQKVQTAIGLILGGIGGGLLHTENPALKEINNLIDRDIESQKSEMGQKDNLLKLNLMKFGNMNEAVKMTQAMLATKTSLELQKAAAQSQDPIAKQRALQAAGTIDAGSAKTIQEMSTLKSQMDLRKQIQQGGIQNADPASLVKMLVPEGQQKDVAHEIGTAQVAAKSKDVLLSHFDQAAKDVRFATGGHPLYGTIINPPSIKAMSALEDPLIHDSEGRVNEFEKKDLAGLRPQSFDSDDTVAAKRQAYQQFIDRKASAPLAKANGIDVQKFQSTMAKPGALSSDDQAKLSYASAHPENPNSAYWIKTLGGK